MAKQLNTHSLEYYNISNSFNTIVVAKNKEQKDMMRTFSESTITFVKGTAGSGKTFLSVSYALQYFLRKKCKNIIFTRPIVEAAGERLGFLPGDMYEKINPYMIPIFDTLLELIPSDLVNKLMKRNSQEAVIRILPLAFMRGTAQPVSCNIITPVGVKKIGNINIGDYVTSVNGGKTKVMNIYPQGIKNIYQFLFSDGSTTRCCKEHLWLTKTLSEKRYKKGFSVKKTGDIIESIRNHNQKNHEIPICDAVEFTKRDVPIDPYLLGLLLGNGMLHESSFSTSDTELIDKINKRLPDNMLCKYSSRYNYRLVCTKNSETGNPLQRELSKLRLIGKNSFTKFIPDVYKINEKQVRIEMIRGLIDGCSIIHRRDKSRCQFYTMSPKLLEDVKFIVQSLGGICYFKQRSINEETIQKIEDQDLRSSHNVFMLDIILKNNPFKSGSKSFLRKSCKTKRMISSIDYVGKEECVCIEVDHPSQLYLTDNFIVTHNTFKNSIVVADECQNSTIDQIRMLLTRIGENTKMIICGDVYQSDINYTSGLQDAFELLQGINGLGFVTLSENAVVRHPMVAEIDKRYRGRKRKPQGLPCG